MQIIPKQDFLAKKEQFISRIREGSIFIYPTDTIYGVGCNALNKGLVNKIRNAKQSGDQPFSVIAPSKDWIIKNLDYKESFKPWLDKLPGPYTLIMNIKNKDCVSEETNNNLNTLGVRIPNNWFSDIVAEAGVPVITTSVNIHSNEHISSTAQIPESIKNLVDFAIDDGIIKGSPSTLVNLSKPEPEIIERK